MLAPRLLPLLITLLLLMSVSDPAHARREPRTRYVELQPMVGYSWVNLTGFSENQFYASLEDLEFEGSPGDIADDAFDRSQIPVSGSGPSVGAALQLKLWVFVLGARYAYTHTTDFGLHTIVGDVGLRLGKTVSIAGRLGPGWAIQTGLPQGINTGGYVVAGSGGLEFKLGEAASLGVGFDADVLLLARTGQLRAVGDAASGELTVSGLQELDGSAVGFQLRPQLHFIWHI